LRVSGTILQEILLGRSAAATTMNSSDFAFEGHSGVLVAGGIDQICDRDRGNRRAGWLFSSPRCSRSLKKENANVVASMVE
jgi:hypothetical protein